MLQIPQTFIFVTRKHSASVWLDRNVLVGAALWVRKSHKPSQHSFADSPNVTAERCGLGIHDKASRSANASTNPALSGSLPRAPDLLKKS